MRNQRDPQQAAVIPIRHVDGGIVQVCLIRRKNSAKWGIPKGYIERLDPEQAVLIEAQEEAGLGGRLIGDAIGTYEYQKGAKSLTVVVYMMEVFEERSTWREMRWRERAWYSIEEAGALLKDHRVRGLCDQIRQRFAARSSSGSVRGRGE